MATSRFVRRIGGKIDTEGSRRMRMICQNRVASLLRCVSFVMYLIQLNHDKQKSVRVRSAVFCAIVFSVIELCPFPHMCIFQIIYILAPCYI